MEKFIKDNILYLLLIIIVFMGGAYLVFKSAVKTLGSMDKVNTQKQVLLTKQEQLEQIKRRKEESQNVKKQEPKSAKIIYEVLGQQFSPEASFGIMFENVISNMTNNGLRIRKIAYNYSPADDKILSTNSPGYNACELYFVTVGNYTQLQNFFKSIAKENYLTSINEVYIEPYERDKSILVARFKVRLYTKTI